jgi:hypothetical protein
MTGKAIGFQEVESVAQIHLSRRFCLVLILARIGVATGYEDYYECQSRKSNSRDHDQYFESVKLRRRKFLE